MHLVISSISLYRLGHSSHLLTLLVRFYFEFSLTSERDCERLDSDNL